MLGDRRPSPTIGSIAFIAMGSILLSLIVLGASAAASSTVHGNVYRWSSFDTLKNAEVVINSVPVQKMVSINGSYAFNLTKGSYTIVAVSGVNSTEVLCVIENVTITQDGGDYVIDLILFPPTNLDDLSLLDENFTAMPPDELSDNEGVPLQVIGLASVAILAVIALVALFLLMRRKKPVERVTAPPAVDIQPSTPEAEPPAVEAVKPSLSDNYTLPDDLKEVIRIMEKNGGRMTQLDLRKALPFSEAKVSLMISDLESRGIVKKIKKGRGNILILNTKENEGESQ